MIRLKISSKGELVIPKKIREQIGLAKERSVILYVKEKSIEIKPVIKHVLTKWEERAKEDVSKWQYGDELYEEVF